MNGNLFTKQLNERTLNIVDGKGKTGEKILTELDSQKERMTCWKETVYCQLCKDRAEAR